MGIRWEYIVYLTNDTKYHFSNIEEAFRFATTYQNILAKIEKVQN